MENLKVNSDPEKLIISPYKYTGDEYDDKTIIFMNDYSFIARYSLLANNSFPEAFKFDLQVRVTNFTIKENIFTYVKYVLEGLNDNREFQLERRYKEFLSYRRLLSQNFPGMFIPPIPPKKSFGNLDEGFIKLRKNFLQHFFNRISAAPHLSSSYATKLFLEKKIEKFYDHLIGINHKSISSIYEFYEDYFKILTNLEISQKQKHYISGDFYLKLNKTKENLKNFLYISGESQNIKNELDKEIQSFYENFYDVDNNYIYDMFKINKETKFKFNKDLIECGLTEIMYKSKYESSITTIYEWANLELIDTEAIMEAIEYIFKYKEILDNQLKKLISENQKLEGYVQSSWFSSFIFSTNLKDIQSTTINVENFQKEVATLKKLIDMIYKILFYIEVPTFKKDKVNFYLKFLEYISKCENHTRDKYSILHTLLKEHCANTLEIYQILGEAVGSSEKGSKKVI